MDAELEFRTRSKEDDAFRLIRSKQFGLLMSQNPFAMSCLQDDILRLECIDHRLVFGNLFRQVLLFKNRIPGDFLNIEVNLFDISLLLDEQFLLFFQLFLYALRRSQHNNHRRFLILLCLPRIQFC